MSFRLKIIFGVAAIEILLLSMLVFSGMRYLSNSNKDQLYDRAHTSAKLFATMTTDPVVAMDLATLDELVEKAVTNPGIVYIRVIHYCGELLAEKGDEEALKRPFSADKDVGSVNDGTFDVAQDIFLNGKSFGRVELGWSTTFYESLLHEAASYMLSVALIEVLLVGIFGYILGRVLTAQLTSLQEGARRVSNGEFGYAIEVRGEDELADTAICFNAMSKALQGYATDLKNAKDYAEVKRIQAENLLQKAVESLPHGVIITDENNKIMHINQAFADIYSLNAEELSKMETCEDVRRALTPVGEEAFVCTSHSSSESIPMTKLNNGRCVLHSYQALASGGAVWVDTDITNLVEVEERNRKLERELLHVQKMESIGTLAGGIAHEINTPIQYIGDNLQFIGDSIDEVMNLLTGYEALAGEAELKNASSGLMQQFKAQAEDADLEFLRAEMPSAVGQSLAGIEQVSRIVLAMKEFAHPSSKEKTLVDINRVIERALVICSNEFKTVAEITLHLAADIPPILAHEGDLNQLILNLVVNAAYAIREKSKEMGRIDVTTKQLPQQILLTVKDDGCGIPKEFLDRVFDPFFTTKEVGKGSGQGLALCYDIVVNKHGGKIDVESVVGDGTTFRVVLPSSSGDSKAK